MITLFKFFFVFINPHSGHFILDYTEKITYTAIILF